MSPTLWFFYSEFFYSICAIFPSSDQTWQSGATCWELYSCSSALVCLSWRLFLRLSLLACHRPICSPSHPLQLITRRIRLHSTGAYHTSPPILYSLPMIKTLLV